MGNKRKGRYCSKLYPHFYTNANQGNHSKSEEGTQINKNRITCNKIEYHISTSSYLFNSFNSS